MRAFEREKKKRPRGAGRQVGGMWEIGRKGRNLRIDVRKKS